MLNILTVDVEDYFHPTEVQSAIGTADWKSFPTRVQGSTERVLELLAKHDAKATFFILGWVAEQFPKLVNQIACLGHEIGCHSFEHQLVYDLTPVQFREDTKRAVAAIENACGLTPRLYRAPSYSITQKSFWALDILAEMGFTHDSSIYPISHDRYGIPGFLRTAHVVNTSSGPIVEVPIATVRLSKARVAPVGGGGYLRLLPYRYTAAGIRRMNRTENIPACIYFHPWEIDRDQPRLLSTFIARLRTYHGLGGMESKLQRLLTEFQFTTISNLYPVVAPQPAELAMSV